MKTITPQPGYTSGDVTALIASKLFVYADCFTIALNDGVTVLRYTSYQQDVSVVPLDSPMRATFVAGDVLISGMKFKLQIGVSVDEQDVKLSCKPTSLINGTPFMLALMQGFFDGATINRDRFFAAGLGKPWMGGAPMFHGRVSTLDSVGRTEAQIKVKSQLVLLNMNMPRTLYAPNCVHTLYDSECTLNRNSFVAHAATTGASSSSVLAWTGATADYQLGSVYIENGAGVTEVRTIKAVDPGVSITLAYPLTFVPATGTLFNAYQGCDRTFARCTAFANTDHFKGFRFVPAPETGV